MGNCHMSQSIQVNIQVKMEIKMSTYLKTSSKQWLGGSPNMFSLQDFETKIYVEKKYLITMLWDQANQAI